MSRAPVPPFGRLLRHWRKTLKRSQEWLAKQAGISVRHLSFIETGRSQPSRETVVAIAAALGVTDQGAFLEAAGFLAPYVDLDWDRPRAQALRREMRQAVKHQPSPALVHDRFGTVLEHNGAMASLFERFIAAPPSDLVSGGHQLLATLRPLVSNWDEIADLYRGRLFRELVRGHGPIGDDQLEALLHMLGPKVDVDASIPKLFTPLKLRSDDVELAFLLLTSTLGTPQDIVLRNFRLVLLVPHDARTAEALA